MVVNLKLHLALYKEQVLVLKNDGVMTNPTVITGVAIFRHGRLNPWDFVL